MDVSVIASLPVHSNENSTIDVKRKRKIAYKKPKGRFTQKASGVLNRSIYKQNTLSHSFSSEARYEQLVAVRDVNSFLEKNKELAKALEESRSHLKQLQNEKFAFQIECNEMREKLSILQNATLSCSCKKTSLVNSNEVNLAFFTELGNSLRDVMTALNNHVTKLALNRCAKEIESNHSTIKSTSSESDTCDSFSHSRNQSTGNPSHKLNKRTQTIPIRLTSTGASVQMRNRKVQVNIQTVSPSVCCAKTSVADKNVQTTGSGLHTTSIEKGVQCDLKKTFDSKSSKITPLRVPLTPLRQKDLLNRSSLKQSQVDVKSILKPKNMIVSQQITPMKKTSKFEIFVDEHSNDKENFHLNTSRNIGAKKVRIYSPAQIRLIECNDDNDDVTVSKDRLRNRNRNINYREPALNRKLTRDCTEVNGEVIVRSRRKVSKKKSGRKRKQKSNRSINLQELITSVLEESFMTILKKD